MRFLLVLTIWAAPAALWAHPVAFKNGFGIMSYNKGDMNELSLNYSFNFNFAVATTYLQTADSRFLIPRLNYLVKRWNNPDSQGNIYLSAGSGGEKFNDQTYGAHLLNFVADWEDRKYYTYFEHTTIKRDNADNPRLPKKWYNRAKARLGFAPFLADYSDLNIWYVAQFERANTDRDKIETTQFLRFFIKNVLWEIGAGSDGNFAFNFMIHL